MVRFDYQESLAREIPAAILRPAGMLGPNDRRLLYLLARSLGRDAAAVVDAGSLIGASAYCLAEGLCGDDAPAADGILHCYDTFRITESYLLDYFRQLLPVGMERAGIAMGWSFQDLFEVQTEPFRRLITVHAGDITNHPSVPPDVALLCIDICTSEAANAAVCADFIPNVRAGGCIVYKEYLRPWHPYVQVAVHLLRAHLQRLPIAGDTSVAFEVIRPVSPELAATLDPARRLAEDCSELFAEIIAASEGGERTCAEAAHVRALQRLTRYADCIAAGTALLEQNPAHPYAAEVTTFVGFAQQQRKW